MLLDPGRQNLDRYKACYHQLEMLSRVNERLQNIAKNWKKYRVLAFLDRFPAAEVSYFLLGVYKMEITWASGWLQGIFTPSNNEPDNLISIDYYFDLFCPSFSQVQDAKTSGWHDLLIVNMLDPDITEMNVLWQQQDRVCTFSPSTLSPNMM